MTLDQKPKRPSFARMAMWLILACIGLYLVLSGVIGIIAKG